MNECYSIFLFHLHSECCRDPEVNAKTYVTSEDAWSSKTVFIVQFVLNCKDGPHVSN